MENNIEKDINNLQLEINVLNKFDKGFLPGSSPG